VTQKQLDAEIKMLPSSQIHFLVQDYHSIIDTFKLRSDLYFWAPAFIGVTINFYWCAYAVISITNAKSRALPGFSDY
jgi:hypothetical protein